MSDKEWGKLILKCNSLAISHREAIVEAEAEYERRFGMNPSDIDDDWWIDAVHYGNGSPDVGMIKVKAKECVERSKKH